MALKRTTPDFTSLHPATDMASAAARGSSRKTRTRPEMLLRRALTRLGLRYRVNFRKLPGRPDIVFPRAQVVIFVDGDFWHGRNLEQRLAKLRGGHNPDYWTKKLMANVQRDLRQTAQLRDAGWQVIRCWEGELIDDAEDVARQIRTRIGPCV